MFLACQKSKVTIKLNCQNCCRQMLCSTAIFNAIAVDWFQGNLRPEWECLQVEAIIPLIVVKVLVVETCLSANIVEFDLWAYQNITNNKV
jgi:hypothetical protein